MSRPLNDSCQVIFILKINSILSCVIWLKTSNILHSALKRPFPQHKLLIIAQSELQLKAGDLSSEITGGGKQGQSLYGAVTSQLIALSWMLLCLFLSGVNVLVNRYIEIKSNGDVHLADYWKGIHSIEDLRGSLLSKHLKLNSL